MVWVWRGIASPFIFLTICVMFLSLRLLRIVSCIAVFSSFEVVFVKF